MILFAPPDGKRSKETAKKSDDVPTTERSRHAQRMRDTRSISREVIIPPTPRYNKNRRARLEADDAAWLRWYFNDPGDELTDRFWYAFTFQQLEMIDAIRHALIYGGDQAIAASRGEGKTKLFERLLLKYVLQGVSGCALLLAATGPKAEDSLASIKRALEQNDRLLADYPEVCVPIRALEYTPNRAHYQTVSGKKFDTGETFNQFPSRFSWCGQEIIFPNVPGSPSAGGIIATRGLDAEVRGINKLNRRPDVVGIDDPETEDSVNTPEQALKLEKRIERGAGFLGGQQRGAARIMLTTLQRRECVSAKFTDPQQKPSWKGKRFRFLIAKPTRMDLWDDYVQQWQTDLIQGDPFARKAHQLYLDNRGAMELGAIVANLNRFDGSILPDGSQKEISALQRYFNEVASKGQEVVSTEFDNDPPEESGRVESGITANRIQKQISGYGRKIVPPGCIYLTQAIDVRKVALHWVVRAWELDNDNCLVRGYTIDYGVQDVTGTTVGSDEGIDESIKRAILARKDTIECSPYADKDGKPRKIDLTLIDAGWRTEAIYESCRELGLDWKPAMGFGKSNGCVQTGWKASAHNTAEKKMGDRWFLSKRTKGTWLVCMDADFWKSWEHDRWMSDPAKNGVMLIYGERSEEKKRRGPIEHMAYSHHIVAEVETEEVIKNVLKRSWKAKSDSNHYLDASYMNDVAASMLGVRIIRAAKTQATMEASAWFGGKPQ